MTSNTVMVQEVDEDLARWLGELTQGRKTVVTNNGVPVARIVPIPPTNDSVAKLILAGMDIQPATSDEVYVPERVKLPDEVTTAMLLAEDREER